MMSLCSGKPGPLAPMRTSSSLSTALKRKSSTPAPPYTSGIMKPSKPT